MALENGFYVLFGQYLCNVINGPFYVWERDHAKERRGTTMVGLGFRGGIKGFINLGGGVTIGF